MPGFYDVKYTDGSPDAEYAGMLGNYYELPDGSHVDLSSCPCWCVNCNTVTDGEWIETPQELEKHLNDLHDPNSEFYQFHEKSEEIAQIPGHPHKRIGFRESAINKTRERIRWRNLRTAPPKCLICGSTVIYYPCDDDGRVEIDGKTVVWILPKGMCSTLFNEWYFTVDGDRIPRDTQPKYWGIPEESTEPGDAPKRRWFRFLKW
jgi:hypothetical protein